MSLTDKFMIFDNHKISKSVVELNCEEDSHNDFINDIDSKIRINFLKI